jgi:transposase
VPAAGADRQFVVFGALDSATGQGHWPLGLRTDRQAFITFLEQLRHAWPAEKLVVVLDHVGDHKSRQTLAWWQQWRHQLGPFFLPAYPPELNRMERVWRYVKAQLSCHRWWADWHALWEATAALVGHLNARVHQAQGPHIELVHNFCSSA